MGTNKNRHKIPLVDFEQELVHLETSTDGYIFTLDLADIDFIEKRSYHLSGSRKDIAGYVTYTKKCDDSGRCKPHYIARDIMSCPEDKIVDYVDGDPLNLRRANLRVTNRQMDARNRRSQPNKPIGISEYKRADGTSSWMVALTHNDVCRSKSFTSRIAALWQYDCWQVELTGTFGRLHMPEMYKFYKQLVDSNYTNSELIGFRS